MSSSFWVIFALGWTPVIAVTVFGERLEVDRYPSGKLTLVGWALAVWMVVAALVAAALLLSAFVRVWAWVI